jgi:TolA-binding protein
VAATRLLLAQTMIQAEQWPDAADFLAKMRSTASGVEWGRLLLLETLCRVNAGQTARALALVDEGHRNWRRLGQITAFELIAIKLAEKLMEEPDKSDAILTLIRIQPRDKLLELQDKQLADLKRYSDTLKRQDVTGIDTMMAGALVDQVKKEREQFAALPNFDSSVRFRMAKAFLDSGRYRETAFVLESMLDQLPPDAIVEQGSVTLAECYTQIGRSDKVIEVVDKFIQKFPNAKEMPAMLIQKGLALQNENKLDESNKVLDDFLGKYPNDPLAANASYLRAFNSILSENFSDAAKRFLETQKKFPSAPTVANALFWQAQAYSMGKQSDLALPLYEAYLQKYPRGESSAEANYRHAYSLYDQRDYQKAVPELEKFIQENPADPNSAEGMLLLGDVYFLRHEYDKAIDILLRIPKGQGNYLEEAYFKVGKYYKLAQDTKKLRALFERFQVEFPNSARVSEAIYQLGLSYSDDPAKQREIFWNAFNRFGDEPKQWGVTNILQALVKASNTPETHTELVGHLRETMEKAGQEKKTVLELNAAWGLAMAQRAADPAAADQTLIAAAAYMNAEVDNPAVLMDIAAAFQRTGKLDEASKIYAEVRRWNPVSTFNQTIFANLGLIAFDQKKLDEARRYFDRYFKETPAADLRGVVMLTSAKIEQTSGNTDKALDYYEKALADKGVGQEQKASALLAVGQIYLDRKQTDKAIPYFQRIYILYGAFPEVVAKAYLLSGRAFEDRKDTLAAARTYIEMLHLPSLADAKFATERAEAETRLNQLPPDVRAKAGELEKQKREAAAQPGGAGI